MSSSPDQVPLLTLEPLLEAVKSGVERAGWDLSGLQKTTSHEFEGRWAGEATRSAYLFFHRPDLDALSIDVFLDETTRGLRANLALVVRGPQLGRLGSVREVLQNLTSAAAETMPAAYKTPITLRLRLAGPQSEPDGAEIEVRFKLLIPKKAMDAGAATISDLAESTVRALEVLAGHPALVPFVKE